MTEERKCSRCHRKNPKEGWAAPKTCNRCSRKHKGAHGSSEAWKAENRLRMRSYNKNWRHELKSAVLSHYGTTCRCCGEKDIRFLTVDHDEGGGRKHRSELGVGAGAPFYRWLRDNGYPSGFTTLCFNCNCGRANNGGMCPHLDSVRLVGS